MPLRPSVSGRVARAVSCVSVAVAVAANGPLVRADPEVIAVVACDGYQDLRKQLTWLGAQIGNPTLVILAESMLAGVTGGRGLAGLDVKRPFGAVLTADGAAVSGCGFLPVTDTDKLLGSLEGVVGPAEKDGDDRKIAPPGAGPVRVATADGWAMLVPEILPAAGSPDPSALIPPLAEDFTLAVQLFPSRMPQDLREQLARQIEAAAARSAEMGQPVDAGTLVAALGSLGDTESITIGLRLDEVKNRVLVEMRSVALPGSAAAKAVADLDDAPLTVPLLKTESRPLARGFVVQRIPEQAAEGILAAIDASEAGDSNDPVTKVLLGSLRAIAKSAVASGRLDGSMTLVNAAAADAAPSLEFTGGVRVKDGAAVQRSLAELLGPAADLPAVVKVKLDDGRVNDATLHTVTIDLSNTDAAATLGESLAVTVAVAPESCHLLFGGDAKARLAGLAGPAAAQGSRPMAAVQLSMDQWLAIAARSAREAGSPQAEPLAAAADAAAAAESSTVQVQVRPIDRGVAWQMAVDAGVLKAAAAVAGLAGAAPGGLPLGPGGPLGGFAP